MSATDPLLNKTIKNYRIEAVLGQGGMGTVYRAIDSQLLRPVALKVMHPQFAVQREFQDRFRQEGRAAAQLDHPNIIRVYEADIENGMLFMVTELVNGGSLRDYLKTLYEDRKFIDVGEALALMQQVAFALDYAHQRGLIHRDVKPDNVLLKIASAGDDNAKFRAILTDFGLAKLSEGGVQSIAANPTGTLPYMSPEQANADPLDARTDIYALGIMLYELTTGRLPFLPRTIPEAIKMHSLVAPERPTLARPSLSPALENVTLRALQKNPGDRYQTAAEFARALGEVMRSGGQARGATGLAVAKDGTPEKSDSLGTYLASMTPAAAPLQGIVAENTSALDRIVVSVDGNVERTFDLTSNMIEIGRDPGLALALISPKVSRNHARVERRADGQYTIMDLGSSNGTFLKEVKLLSNIPQVWDPEDQVRVGGFLLTLQRASVGYVTGVAVKAAPGVSIVPGIPAPAGAQGTLVGGGGRNVGGSGNVTSGIDLKLSPQAISVEAGSRADMQVEIRNLSELVEHYQFSIDGIPKEWYTLPPSTLQLMTARDGESVSRGSISLAFHPPRNCKSTSGAVPVIVRVTSQDRGKEVGRATLMLSINPFYNYKAELQPKKIRNAGNLKVIVKNDGNAVESYTFSPTDREESLHFDPPVQSVTVPPCLDEVSVFYVRAQKRPLLSLSAKHYQFEVGVTASGSPLVQPLNGELVLSPRIPWWLLMLLLLLCIGCILAILLLRCQFFPGFCPVVTTPNLTSTAQHATLDTWLTATANQFDIRQTATTDSRLKTATASAGNITTQTAVFNVNATSTQAAVNNAASTADTLQQRNLLATSISAQQTIAAAAAQPTRAP